MPLPAAPTTGESAGSVPDLVQDWRVRGPVPTLVIGQKDDYGNVYWWEDLSGWFDLPGIDTPISPRGNSDRAIAATRFARKERYVTIKGVCHVSSPAENFPARERLVSAWDRPNDEFDLIVEEPTPKKLRVRAAGPIAIPWNEASTLSFGFEIPLVAVNPYKQGLNTISGITGPTVASNPTLTFPITFPLTFVSSGHTTGTLPLYNEGNADAYPVINVSGPTATGWKITNETTGDSVSFDVPVNDGQTLTIDTERQSLMIGTYPVQARRVGEWPVLQPGPNQYRFTTPTGYDSAVMTVVAAPAFK